VEAGINGSSFSETGIVFPNKTLPDNATYSFNYNIPFGTASFVDFRIKMINEDGTFFYSRVLRVNIKPSAKMGITIAPNPVRSKFQMEFNSPHDATAKILFFDMQGRSVMTMNETVKKGTNLFTVSTNENWQPGIYTALVKINEEVFTARFVVLE
jgi:hypothetical protein